MFIVKFFLSVPFFKVLKLYAWEESFMKQIKRIRDKELKFLRNTGLWTAGFMFTFNCAPTLVSCVHKSPYFGATERFLKPG